jgi:iron(III) transport system substrate-binding protein
MHVRPSAATRSALLLLLSLALCACTRTPDHLAVAVGMADTAARPLLHEFSGNTGTTVDTRAADDSDVDLLWARDPEVVLQLAARGSLAVLPGTDTYGRPASMIDPRRQWIATSVVARSLLYDPARIAEADVPTRIRQLSQPEVGRQLVLADPTHGSAAWHAAALFSALGEPEAVAFYQALVANGALVVADEDAVLAAIFDGRRPLGLIDSDRAFAAQESRPQLVTVLPDQDAEGVGAFLLPTVVAVTTRGAANRASQALLDFLLSAPVTRRLALTTNAILPLSDPAEVPAGLLSIRTLRVMPVSYADLAARLPAVRQALSRLAAPT